MREFLGLRKSLYFTVQGPRKAKMAILGGPELDAGIVESSENLQVTFRRRVEITCKFSVLLMIYTASSQHPKMAIFAVFYFYAQRVTFT